MKKRVQTKEAKRPKLKTERVRELTSKDLKDVDGGLSINISKLLQWL